MTLTFLLRKAFLLSAIFLITILFSCKKDGELSPNFDNGNLAVIFTDTFSIKTTVEKDVSLRTDNSNFQLLGVYNDPIFGIKSSSIYANFGLPGLPTDLGTNPVIDSVVLTLDIVGFYGDTASSLIVNVFELNNSLEGSTGYTSSTYTSAQGTLLGTTTFKGNSTESIITAVDNDTLEYHLRIKLNDPTLIGNLASNSPYTSNSNFNTVFKGLHIVTSDTASIPAPIAQGTGFISHFDVTSSLSGITVYYNNDDADSLQTKFIMNTDIKKYSRFINNYSGTDIEKHLNNDVTKNTNRIYVSDMEGIRTKIEIPNFRELTKEGNISINKAEIIFTVETGSDVSPDDILEAFKLSAINSVGEAVDILDEGEGIAHFGGEYNATTKSFTYNITRHLQQLINTTDTDYGMYLVANGIAPVANRIVLNSETSPVSKIKLEITYSKL